MILPSEHHSVAAGDFCAMGCVDSKNSWSSPKGLVGTIGSDFREDSGAGQPHPPKMSNGPVPIKVTAGLLENDVLGGSCRRAMRSCATDITHEHVLLASMETGWLLAPRRALRCRQSIVRVEYDYINFRQAQFTAGNVVEKAGNDFPIPCGQGMRAGDGGVQAITFELGGSLFSKLIAVETVECE